MSTLLFAGVGNVEWFEVVMRANAATPLVLVPRLRRRAICRMLVFEMQLPVTEGWVAGALRKLERNEWFDLFLRRDDGTCCKVARCFAPDFESACGAAFRAYRGTLGSLANPDWFLSAPQADLHVRVRDLDPRWSQR